MFKRWFTELKINTSELNHVLISPKYPQEDKDLATAMFALYNAHNLLKLTLEGPESIEGFTPKDRAETKKITIQKLKEVLAILEEPSIN